MALLVNLEVVFKGIGGFFALLSPVFIGFCTAFLLNRPYMLVNSTLLKLSCKIGKKKKEPTPRRQTVIKILSLVLVYISFLLFITLIISMILPQLGDSVSNVAANISVYASNLTKLFDTVDEFLHLDVEILDWLTSYVMGFVNQLPEFVTNLIPDIFDVTKSVASIVTNALLGFIMSIYMLASKDMLINQLKSVFYAFVPEKPARKITHILEISNDIFGNFVNGRIYDALIIGLLCFIGMSIFGFEYTLLITVLVAVTNIIPIFGPFIGAIPSIFLLLLVDPMQAVWFTVFIIVLQQIDGNIIGPKVVGDSIGLPAWWVMFSILIGGGVGGVFGMLMGVPLFAVLYRLLFEAVENRNEKKAAEALMNNVELSDSEK